MIKIFNLCIMTRNELHNEIRAANGRDRLNAEKFEAMYDICCTSRTELYNHHNDCLSRIHDLQNELRNCQPRSPTTGRLIKKK